MSAKRYAMWALMTALGSAAALVPVGLALSVTGRVWLFSGWVIMALFGLVGGLWMTTVHGRDGADFLVALGTCMLARLAVAASGAFFAARAGMEAVWPYLAGLAVGFISMQVLEVGWFLRKAKIGL